MIATWSVKDGGRLCECGYMKCEHIGGTGPVVRREPEDILPKMFCHRFDDRAPETAEAA